MRSMSKKELWGFMVSSSSLSQAAKKFFFHNEVNILWMLWQLLHLCCLWDSSNIVETFTRFFSLIFLYLSFIGYFFLIINVALTHKNWMKETNKVKMLHITYSKYDHACCTLPQLHLKRLFCPLIRHQEMLEGILWPHHVICYSMDTNFQCSHGNNVKTGGSMVLYVQ